MTRKQRATSLLLFGVFLFTSLFFSVQTALASGSSCTGWSSKSTPPVYIRVLNTRTSYVRKVRFEKYVGQVMASGEFPTYLPRAVLHAGAQAVKQYGWYYALAGHWRGGSSHGICYDVVNTTNDQLWHPKAEATRKQLRAVHAVWSLSLWKWNRRFFATGYRAGYSSVCGRDVDGWRLYERSAVDCAQRGWSGSRILHEYYTRTVFRTSSGGAGASSQAIRSSRTHVVRLSRAIPQ